MDRNITINNKSGSGNGGNYFSNKTQGGGYSTSGGNGTSGTSGGSQTQNSSSVSYTGNSNSQGLGKEYHYTEVLGTAGNKDKNIYGHSAVVGYIIDFCRKTSTDCWGSNGLQHGYGGRDGPINTKAINLANTDMDNNDAGNLFYVLRDFNFNLDIINLSNNRIGDLGVESMIYGITSLQYQTLYSADNGWKPYQSNLKTVQNVITINLSNNQIGDGGAKLLADYLANGSFPSTKTIVVYDNQITSTGYGFLAKGLEAVSQDLKIVFEAVKGFSKDALKASMKSMLFIAKNNGISTKETLTTGETIEHCKNGIANVGLNIGVGYLKCTSKIVKAYNYKDITIGDVASEILGLYAQPLKGVLNFACITQNTVFSVVDEEFANCLVGVDSLLNE